MRVLVACEASGTVTAAFRNKGIEAYSVDIIPTYGNHPKHHIIGDAIEEAYSGKYDMLIAFPPCTYLSNAGAVRLFPKGVRNEERYQKGLEAKEFFMALLHAPVTHVCIENPTPLKCFELPPQTQVIQPWHHGHPYTKRTLLWLRNLPQLKRTDTVTGNIQSWVKVHRNVTKRQKTFDGIAEAMADQWHNPAKFKTQLSMF